MIAAAIVGAGGFVVFLFCGLAVVFAIYVAGDPDSDAASSHGPAPAEPQTLVASMPLEPEMAAGSDARSDARSGQNAGGISLAKSPGAAADDNGNGALTAVNESPAAIDAAPAPQDDFHRPGPIDFAATLEHLKGATVLIKVATSAGWQSGSGFLIKVEENRGLIATNAHVVAAEEGSVNRVLCVFHSGERGEFEVAARIDGKDDANDLAFLTVTHDSLPQPIDSASDVQLHETAPVLVVGFPFGEILTTSNRNPAVTISKGAISSIRRDDDDNVVLWQIDGGVNPGNSGGPVVTEDGRLVGIAVAKVLGSDIGFAIPKQVMSEALEGHVARVVILEIARGASSPAYRVKVEFVDPNRRITSASVLTFRAASQHAKAPAADGRWGRASSEAETTSLRIANGAAEGSLTSTPAGGLFQIEWTRSDGTTRYTAPAPIRSRPESPAALARRPDSRQPRDSAPSAPPTDRAAPGASTSPALDAAEIESSEGELLQLPGEYVDVDVAGAGKYLVFNLGPRKQLAVVDVAQRNVAAVLNVAAEGLCAAGADKIVFVAPTQRLIQRWDLATFKREKTTRLDLDVPPSVIAMGCASHGPILVAGGGRTGQQYKVFDLDTLKPRNVEYAQGRRFEAGDGSRVRASADGRVFTMWRTGVSPAGFFVLTVDGPTAHTYYDHATVGHIAPGPNGSRLYTMHGVFTPQIKLIEPNTADGQRPIMIPAVQGGYYLRLERIDRHPSHQRAANPSLSIHMSGYDGEILTVPKVNMRGGVYGDNFARDEIGLDQRVYFIPQANVLATLPEANNSVAFLQVDLDVELERSGMDYLFVNSTAETSVAAGAAYDYQVSVKSKHGGVAYKLTAGPDGMRIDSSGDIQWNPTVRDVGFHDVIVTVSDASGQEVFHTFQVEVLPAGRRG